MTRSSSKSPAQEIVGVTESLYQLTDGHPGSEEVRDIGGAIATSGHREPGPGVITAAQWSLDITDATCVNASNQTTPRQIYELLFFS